MSLIMAPAVKRSPAEDMAAEDVAAEDVAAEALIAEARAHARRRRVKIAVAMVALAVAAAAAVLIGRAAVGSHGTAHRGPQSAAPAAATGIVTGHLAACFGIRPKDPAQAITPGTVVAFRGRVTYRQVAPGSWRAEFPKGPVVASQHISNNQDQAFRLALSPGHYVIAGHYDENPAGIYAPFTEVTVTTGATIRVDLPNPCM
ncbi:MAG TPA: hypothetical protein VKU77_22655 [Streptosporangiaceae bacterium]|nr:hypothetical protein [Streptosporangiaceae bacterium]